MKKPVHILQLFLLMAVSTGMLCAGLPAADADFTGNGTVDLADYSIFAAAWRDALGWFPDGGLPPGIIAHWPLDQNAMDRFSIFDAEVHGTPVWFTKNGTPAEVKIGSGAVGMAGDAYLAIDAERFPHLSGSFTLEAWIKTELTQQAQAILSKGSSSWQIGIEAQTGKVFFACPGLSGTGYLAGNTVAADGFWHHVAGVYDAVAGTVAVYLDGAVDAQAPASGTVDENDLDIWIGGNPQTAQNRWHGTLDNVCIYNEARSLEQVFNQTTYHVDVQTGKDIPGTPDPEWGRGRQKAFKTIQHAIDVAADGDIIMVWPGMYQESLFFMGKAVTVRSAADAAILQPDPADGIAVTFMFGEQSGSVLENFVIRNSDIALYIHQSSPTLKHLTVVDNDYGMESIFNAHPQTQHCIFWNNFSDDIHYDTYAPQVTYSCIQRPYPGEGNFSSNPLFVNPDGPDPNILDFHLQSAYGRYLPDGPSDRPMPGNWVIDVQTSPCIDAGDPAGNPLRETMCNGGRINIGAYGNTAFASKSAWLLPADMNYNGQVSLKDLLLFSEQWLRTEGPNGTNN